MLTNRSLRAHQTLLSKWLLLSPRQARRVPFRLERGDVSPRGKPEGWRALWQAKEAIEREERSGTGSVGEQTAPGASVFAEQTT